MWFCYPDRQNEEQESPKSPVVPFRRLEDALLLGSGFGVHASRSEMQAMVVTWFWSGSGNDTLTCRCATHPGLDAMVLFASVT